MSDGKDFDPVRHRMAPQRWFEDFELGERFVLPSRTQTEALFAAFHWPAGTPIQSITTWSSAARAQCRTYSRMGFRF